MDEPVTITPETFHILVGAIGAAVGVAIREAAKEPPGTRRQAAKLAGRLEDIADAYYAEDATVITACLRGVALTLKGDPAD